MLHAPRWLEHDRWQDVFVLTTATMGVRAECARDAANFKDANIRAEMGIYAVPHESIIYCATPRISFRSITKGDAHAQADDLAHGMNALVCSCSPVPSDFVKVTEVGLYTTEGRTQ